MNYANLLTVVDNGILTITINRPDRLNALNKKTIEELSIVLKNAEGDDEVKAIIITGSGQKAFVAGADISEFANYTAEQGKALSAKGHVQLFDLVQNLAKPVIAAINGFALGGGLELAMACHIRIASDNAKMGLPEVSLGVIPGYGGTQRLAQLVGKGKAFEMIMTADMITTEDAYKWGLINHITTQENLLAKCTEMATKIISLSPSAIASAIRAVNANFQNGVNGFEVEIEEFGKCFATQDFKEGTSAFLEKRKPGFTGK